MKNEITIFDLERIGFTASEEKDAYWKYRGELPSGIDSINMNYLGHWELYFNSDKDGEEYHRVCDKDEFNDLMGYLGVTIRL